MTYQDKIDSVFKGVSAILGGQVHSTSLQIAKYSVLKDAYQSVFGLILTLADNDIVLPIEQQATLRAAMDEMNFLGQVFSDKSSWRKMGELLVQLEGKFDHDLLVLVKETFEANELSSAIQILSGGIRSRETRLDPQILDTIEDIRRPFAAYDYQLDYIIETV